MHPTYQRHLEQSCFLPKVIKLGTGDHGARIKVQHAERLTQRHVILGLETKSSLAANLDNQRRLVLAPYRHVRMCQVGQLLSLGLQPRFDRP